MPPHPLPLRPASLAPAQDKPHNLEAEQALLACLLANNLAFEQAREVVRADDFYNPIFGKIYAAIGETIDAGIRADQITLRALFKNDAEIMQLGGADYLAQLTGHYVSIINARDYATTIAFHATQRRLLNFACEVSAQVREANTDAPPGAAEQLIENTETLLYGLAERREAGGGATPMPPLFDQTFAAIEEAHKSAGKSGGISTGIAALDKKLGLLMPGNFVVIAARPSMGKTALGLSVARNVAGMRIGVLFHTMEMSEQEIMQRLIARETGISTERQQKGDLNAQDFDAVVAAGSAIKALPLLVDDSGALTVPVLRARALRALRRHGIRLLVVDYLGLMRPVRERMNKTVEVGEISNGLKALAKELKIPIVALVQLNRALESRDDKRPQLSDLRDSGEIEQDADVVGFLYRDEYYLVRGEPKQRDNETIEHFNLRWENWDKKLEASRNKGDVIIAKRRGGETGIATLHFSGLHCRYSDLENAGAV